MSLLGIAAKNLFRRKSRTIISIFVIALSVALITGVAISNSSTIAAFRKFFESAAGNTDIMVVHRVSMYYNESDVSFIEDIQDIRVSKFIYDSALVKTAKNESIALLTGVNPDAYYLEDLNITGSDDLRNGTIIINRELADAFNLEIGDNLTVITFQHKVRNFTIIGIDDTKRVQIFTEQRNYVVIMTLKEAQEFTNHTGKISTIYIDVLNNEEIETVKNHIENKLGENYRVYSPTAEFMKTVEQAVSGFSIGLTFFAVFIAILAMILIANSLLMSLEERKYEIGILRTLGFSRRQIFLETLLETLFMGSIGIVIGIALGVVIAQLMSDFYFLIFGIVGQSPELVITTDAIIRGLILGGIASFLSGIYPAIHASRVTIIEALRRYKTEFSRVRTLVYLAAGIILLVIGSLSRVIGFDVSSLRIVGLVIIAGVVIKELEGPISKVFGRIFGAPGIIGSRIATRHLRRTVLTIAIITLTVSFAVGIAGTQKSWDNIINDLPKTVFTFDIIVYSRTQLSWSFQDNISKVEGVDEVAPFAVAGTVINKTGNQNTVIIVDFESFRKVMQLEILNGSLDNIDNELIVIFEKVAAKLNVTAGDYLKILTLKGWKKMKIAAIFKSTGFEDFIYLAGASMGQSIYINKETAEEYFGFEGKANVFLVTVKEGYNRGGVAKDIKKEFSSYKIETITVDDLINRVSAISNQIFAFFYVIISVGLIIGGLGIFIVASQTIIQRRWEFGVLRSIGFGRWDIAKIIFSEALLISVTAFILAIIDLPFSLQEAVEASAAASGVLHLEYVFPWDALVIYFVIVILLALLGAAKPAYSITKENIVAILRRE